MKRYLNLIEESLKRFYGRIISHTSISTAELSFYRIVLGIFFLIYKPDYSWLADVPQGFYRPNVLTLARLYDSWPGPFFFELTDLAITASLIMVVFGIKARVFFLLLFFLTIIGNSFVYAFGKIDHSIFSSLIFLLFFFTNSGTKLAFWPDKKNKTQDLALAIFSVSLVFAFFTAGFEKALNWIDFDIHTSGVFRWFYSGYFNYDRTALLAEYFYYAPLWLTESMDYMAVLFEISGLFFLLYSRKSWYLYLIIAAIFHLMNTLILNISFLNHLVVYGIWLLNPLFIRYKYAFLFFSVGLLIKGLYLVVVLWSIFIGASIVNWALQFPSTKLKKWQFFLSNGMDEKSPPA